MTTPDTFPTDAEHVRAASIAVWLKYAQSLRIDAIRRSLPPGPMPAEAFAHLPGFQRGRDTGVMP